MEQEKNSAAHACRRALADMPAARFAGWGAGESAARCHFSNGKQFGSISCGKMRRFFAGGIDIF